MAQKVVFLVFLREYELQCPAPVCKDMMCKFASRARQDAKPDMK